MPASLREYLALCLVLLAVDVYARPPHHEHVHARLLHRHHHHHHDTALQPARRSLPSLTNVGEHREHDLENSHMRGNGVVERGLSSVAENTSAARDDPSANVAGTDNIPTGIMTLVTETSQKMASMVKDLAGDKDEPAALEGTPAGESEEDRDRRKKLKKIQDQALRLEDLRRRNKDVASDAFNRFFQARKRRARGVGHAHAV